MIATIKLLTGSFPARLVILCACIANAKLLVQSQSPEYALVRLQAASNWRWGYSLAHHRSSSRKQGRVMHQKQGIYSKCMDIVTLHESINHTPSNNVPKLFTLPT